ncbi:UvrD-helicase domain-containing protein [Deferribacterales bacterium Es71-Z0220]|uniref:UvrD-helicase domain-containing protein n=1 Tax=Deferrivibrio essentukiensis TaxID=2880922 RepID=UPI001F6258A2|nr:UvrD-helicase domain-containing protein [Deferrivibrio essentukiensis]MCB4204606.1 UvrD-helicase domain-containing protein [Deferrivibrio essentukiensis]
MLKPSLCTQASAGSGKTYRLASRYIHLLKLIFKGNIKDNFPEILNPDSIGSIVALTFTNKAAAEMKDRIILFLKKLADIYPDKDFDKNSFGIKENEAANLLVDIIKNYGDFNVTTLDSFMNKILKAFAIEKKIMPDYEVFFESDEIFELAFGDVVSNPDNFIQLLDFLIKLLDLGQSGVNPEKIIFDGLSKYKDIDIPENLLLFENLCEKLEFDNKNFAEIQSEIETNLLENFRYFQELFSEHADIFNKTNIKKFKKSDINEMIQQLGRYEEILTEGSLVSLYKGGGFLDEAKEKEFISRLTESVDLLKKYMLLKSSFETDVVARQLKRLRDKEEEIKHISNIVDGQKVAKDVSEILSENDISYAFLKLGEKISHYLIDEFQDTSKEQFDAIFPLIENAVSEGGTLFIVGDKKQAIYGWRGGDYTIFDEALKSDSLRLEEEFTDTNYRSAKNIVNFNNFTFNTSNLLNANLLGIFEDDLGKDFKILMMDAIEGIYGASEQKYKNENDGYLEIILQNVADNDESEDFYRDEFVDTLKKVINDYKVPPSDIMILLRKKGDIDLVVSWMREYFEELPFVTEDSMRVSSNFEIKKLLFIANVMTMPENQDFDKIFSELKVDKETFDNIKSEIAFLSPYEIFCKIISADILNYNDNKVYFERFLEEVLKISDKHKTLEDVLEYFNKKKDITISLNENIEAVKIMTIHKSKGLESHTVIIPFYDWKLYDKGKLKDAYHAVNIEEFTGEPDYLLIKLTKARDFLKDGRDKYFEKFKNEIVENLNLMYVANTRARENLFVIGQYKKDIQENRYGRQISASDLLHMILENSEYGCKSEKTCNERYIVGEMKKCSKIKYEEKPVEDDKVEINANFRGHLKIYEKETYLNFEKKERLKGELFHLGMSFLSKVDFEKDLKAMINDAYFRAVNLMRYSDEDVKPLMMKAVLDLRKYFEDIDAFWNEKEFVDRYGNIMRLDRVVKIGREITVIDYKTGEKDLSHELQMRRYMKIFDNCRGIIYYSDTGEIFDVV